jgi:hypothetical protein
LKGIVIKMKTGKLKIKKWPGFLLLSTVAILFLAIFLLSACSEEGAAATGVTAIAGFAGLYICIAAIAWLAGIFFFIVWIIMLVDCAKRENSDFPDANPNSKMMWILIIVLAGGIGAIIYYFIVMRKMPKKKEITKA